MFTLKRLGLYALCIGTVTFGAVTAQVAMEADPGTGTIIKAENTDEDAHDGVAVEGVSVPQPYYGIGGRFKGGYFGVWGISNTAGSGDRFGGYFEAANGNGINYGLFSYADTYDGYAGYFDGHVHITGNLENYSDARLKRNIARLENPLDKILTLEPTTFYFDTTKTALRGLPRGRQNGLLSQDVKRTFPELVSDIPVPSINKKRTGENIGFEKTEKDTIETYEGVNYIGLIPVLIGAIKEQQKEIEELRALVAKKNK